MSETVKKAKSSVAGCKGHVTQALTACDRITESADDACEIDSLKEALAKLRERFTAYQNAYYAADIIFREEECGEDMIKDESDKIYTQTLLVENVVKLCCKKIASLELPAGEPTRQGSHPPRPLKLPAVQLPKFSGDPLEYESFWDQFKSQIHTRSDIEPAGKLVYLRSLLTGNALELVKSLPATDTSYQLAVDRLKANYGDEKRIKVAIFRKMRNLPYATYSYKDLASFRLTMLNLSQSLRIKHDYSMCEWFVEDIFQEKLPVEITRQLYNRHHKRFFSLDEMSDGIKDRLDEMDEEATARPAKIKSSTTTTSAANETKIQKRQDSTAVGIYSTSTSPSPSDSKPRTTRACQLCSGKHSTSRCHEYESVTSRLQRIRALNLCERCLGEHLTKSCQTKLYPCLKCEVGKHHTVLCQAPPRSYQGRYNRTNAPSTSYTHTRDKSSTNHCGVTIAAARAQESMGALPTAIAKLIQGTAHEVRLFFDAGAQMTFITRELVERANIPIAKTTNMSLSGFMASTVNQDFPIIKAVVQLGQERKRIRAVVVDTLPSHIRTIGLTEAIQILQAKGIAIADPHIEGDTVGAVDILIGADQYYNFVTKPIIVREGIHLMKTAAGHSISGPIPAACPPTDNTAQTGTTSSENVALVMKVTHLVDPLPRPEIVTEPETPVHRLWDLDVIGIDTMKAPPEETKSYQEYLNTVQYSDGQYWVKLPWRTNKPELPVNYRKALGQMHSLVKELQRKGDHLQLYHQIIQDQLRAKFIEEVPHARPIENSHYLPHHAVSKDSVTTPLRIVFNCSAKEAPGAASLNDCLMTGPSLTEKIGDVLLKFRTGQFAYTADISKAFLRVGLQDGDRDFTRFLWPENPDNPHSRIKTYRFRSVLFGATSSPFLLQATLDYHLRRSSGDLRQEIASQLYIDNLQGGTSDEQHLLAIYTQANRELQEANMPLQQWTTNNPMLKAQIEQDFPDYQVPDETNILGLKWHIPGDELSLKPVSFCDSPRGLTKRLLLANVSKAFDPLGLFTPVTIKGKMLIQQAWIINADWDEILPDAILQQWETIAAEISMLHTVPVTRKVGEAGESYQLHIFCDASSLAYGAVAYLTNSSESHLVTSKARVSPIKTRTLPQLELTAILVGTKLGVYIHKVLCNVTIQRTCVWSDSEVALQWLRNDRSKLTYVQNRVSEIHDIQTDFSFLHVQSENNPADHLSRGLAFRKFQSNSLWFHGPEWLSSEAQWPEQKSMVVSNGDVVCPISVQNDPSESPATRFLDPQSYSSLAHLLRVTTIMFRFINNLYQRRGVDHQLDSALVFWIKCAQAESYSPVIRLLKDAESPSPQSLRNHKIVKDLGLYLDPKGVLRCRGRLQNSELEYAAKHPVLLPKTSWLSQLIILEAHATVLHGGVSDTLTHIRQQFWIPQGRQSVKTCIRKCKTCIRYDGRTCQYPGPPPLPVERVHQSRPFEVSGVDFTGAITISDTPDGDPIKVYVCLFTCATTRGIHLELASDLSAATFLNLFRRFAARRSCPRLVISDNGTNLRAGGAFLKSYFSLPEVQRFFSYRRCEWKFIPPRAPWQGGFYERCIGIVKQCLRKVLHNKCITLEELRTLLVEIEARVNNRPLTYVNENINEPEALTPSHLLTGDRIEPVPPAPFHGLREDPDFRLNPETPTVEGLNERFRKHTKLLMRWNKVWRDDYLTSLREYFYGADKPSSSNPLKPGDVVLVEREGSRADWPLGRVVSIHPDDNGALRLVKVDCKGVTSLRTVEKLIPFEISQVEPDTSVPVAPEPSPDRQDKPSRRSAKRAQSQWRNLHSEGAI